MAELPAREQALLHEETEQLKEALQWRPIVDVASGVSDGELVVHPGRGLADPGPYFPALQHPHAATQQVPMPADLQDQPAVAVEAWRTS